MGRGVASPPEIARGRDEPRSEVMLPHPVDDHPGRQRVRRGSYGLRQFEPSAALYKGLAIRGINYGRVVEILKILHDAKISKIALITQAETDGGH